jgi:hypothetical protein
LIDNAAQGCVQGQTSRGQRRSRPRPQIFVLEYTIPEIAATQKTIVLSPNNI